MKSLTIILLIVGISTAIRIQNQFDADKSTISVKILTNLRNSTNNLRIVNNVVSLTKTLQPTVSKSTTTSVVELDTKIAVLIEIAKNAASCDEVAGFFEKLDQKYGEIVGILVNCGNEVDIIV